MLELYETKLREEREMNFGEVRGLKTAWGGGEYLLSNCLLKFVEEARYGSSDIVCN